MDTECCCLLLFVVVVCCCLCCLCCLCCCVVVLLCCCVFVCVCLFVCLFVRLFVCLLLLYGTPLNACVCTLRITRARKLVADSTRADLETWACAHQNSTDPGPGTNRTVLKIMLIATPPLQSTPEISEYPEQCNLFQTRGRACIYSPTRCAVFWLVEFFSYQVHNH